MKGNEMKGKNTFNIRFTLIYNYSPYFTIMQYTFAIDNNLKLNNKIVI